MELENQLLRKKKYRSILIPGSYYCVEEWTGDMETQFTRLVRIKHMLMAKDNESLITVGANAGFPMHLLFIPMSNVGETSAEGNRKFDKRFNDSLSIARREVYTSHDRLIEGIVYSMKADVSKPWYAKAIAGSSFVVSKFDENTVRTFRALGCGQRMLRDIAKAMDTVGVKIKGIDAKFKQSNIISRDDITQLFKFGTVIKVKNVLTGMVSEKKCFLVVSERSRKVYYSSFGQGR